MSDTPEVTVARPLPITSTVAIDRGNRLLSLRNHPGFLDLIRISLDLVQEAGEAEKRFDGWDPMQIIARRERVKGAELHHQALFQRLQEAINEGYLEAQNLSTGVQKSAAEVIEQHDYMRQRVLQQMGDFESRVAGSYDPTE